MAGLDLRNMQTAQHHNDTLGSKNKISPSTSSEKGVMSQDIQLFPTRLSDKQKEALYLELATMLAAGVDIKAALDLVEEEQQNKRQAKIIQDIKDQVVNGASFSRSLQLSNYFTPYEYHSIQIGEEIGKLSPVLHELARYFTQKLKQRRQFTSALSYPLLVLATSLGAVGFMLYFIVPMFSDVFKRFGGDLPYVTQLIINLSQGLSNYFWVILLTILGTIGGTLLVTKKLWFQRISAQLITHIPVFGRIYTGIYLAQFCSSMALLVGAKVPLLRAVQLVRQMIAFHPIHHALTQIEQDIMQGRELHQSLSCFPIFDTRLVALIKVGEEVNQLDVFFQKLSLHYSEDVEHKTSLLSTFMEPLMIIFLGLVVGFILIAMYLPMFQLSTSIGG
ncbi:type II secretion system F family protein [Tunicatimonas pelagia]|uniref:type II secretion system F family protein n=1 Tax=Tunicatimonas pelagia TaxID=931531 RepID=UPI0026657192|nr:type II secretion system F family protein [Tunicatimonas pelagia]WKN45349.1 type II secretion system F family protein [Tunicatimonas pelagia]